MLLDTAMTIILQMDYSIRRYLKSQDFIFINFFTVAS